MSALIDEFRHEHAQITSLLLQAKCEGIQSDKGKALILSAKKMLLAHLNKEDRLLYPALQEASLHNEDLKKTLAVCTDEMSHLSSDVMVFFSLYENGTNTDANFQTDCNAIIKALSKCISKEEAILYPCFDNLPKA